MRVNVSLKIALSLLGAALASCATVKETPAELVEGTKLTPFASDSAFQTFLEPEAPAQNKAGYGVALPAPPAPVSPTMEYPSSPSVAYEAATDAGNNVIVTGTAANPEITNNQVIGVDEGGIIKQIGRSLIILQDGRLFVVDTDSDAKGTLKLTDRFNVYRSTGTAAEWYDEMLVTGNRILVTAYSYKESATEVSVFTLGKDGRVTRDGRYLLSSSDYYSGENYATRLVGGKLVVYAPFDLYQFYGDDAKWPTIRQVDEAGKQTGEAPLLTSRSIYGPVSPMDYPQVHNIAVCDIGAKLTCNSTAIIGDGERETFISPTDFFLWTNGEDNDEWAEPFSFQCSDGKTRVRDRRADPVFRIPLDGSAPSMLMVEGVPDNQFSFDSDGKRFRMLLDRDDNPCDAKQRDLALLDVPLSAFSASVKFPDESNVTALPPVEGDGFENRFLGDWLLYSSREGWTGYPPEQGDKVTDARFVAIPLANPKAPQYVDVDHNALRIERAGPKGAVVTGYKDEKGLRVSYLSLGKNKVQMAATTLMPNRFESEGRSHAFNANINADESGLMGIPTRKQEWRAGRWWFDSQDSDLTFLALDKGSKLAPAGSLAAADTKPNAAYDCEVSCIDWYGNSRPIFTGGRTFGLMGVSLVEGRMDSGNVTEGQRVDLTAPLDHR